MTKIFRTIILTLSLLSFAFCLGDSTTAQIPAANTAVVSLGTESTSGQDFIIFSINTQDFSHPAESATVLNKIIDLHESHNIPVDIYLTDVMADIFADEYPDLLERLKTSPWVAISYHYRAPRPYANNYDWLGLRNMDSDELYETILRYETQAVDPVTGQTTEAPGGYQNVNTIIGYPPYSASSSSGDPEINAAVMQVFRELGAQMTLTHGRALNLGDTKDGLLLRPEHVDYKLFEHVGNDPAETFETMLEKAHFSVGGQAPYFIGVKMHDNDFFTERSAWLTVYLDGGKRPEWDPSLASALISQAEQDAMWEMYEQTVRYVASQEERITAVNLPLILEMLQGETNDSSTSQSKEQTLLYISGTMHIENNRLTWPDPDALIEFFERATATGMRWSIGADIDWLNQEPRAGEIIQATEAMGIEWDVHTHALLERANASSRITELGGHSTKVVSGMLLAKLDALFQPIAGKDGSSWQAEILWGISGLTGRGGHAPGNDDQSIGLWRPTSADDYTTHDPNGLLITVGSGNNDNLADIEKLTEAIAAGGKYPYVLSIRIMVQPATLLTPISGEGIDDIEAWADRLSAYDFVRWATIAETAAAWEEAGSTPSRIEDWP